MSSLLIKTKHLVYRRSKSSDRCGLAQFCQKFMKYPVELIGYFHHGCMAAMVDKMQFTVRDQLIEFPAYKGRGHGVIIAPNQQRGLFDLVQFFPKIISNGAFCQDIDDVRYALSTGSSTYRVSQLPITLCSYARNLAGQPSAVRTDVIERSMFFPPIQAKKPSPRL